MRRGAASAASVCDPLGQVLEDVSSLNLVVPSGTTSSSCIALSRLAADGLACRTGTGRTWVGMTNPGRQLLFWPLLHRSEKVAPVTGTRLLATDASNPTPSSSTRAGDRRRPGRPTEVSPALIPLLRGVPASTMMQHSDPMANQPLQPQFDDPGQLGLAISLAMILLASVALWGVLVAAFCWWLH